LPSSTAAAAPCFAIIGKRIGSIAAAQKLADEKVFPSFP
jgi:hypothetical protein